MRMSVSTQFKVTGSGRVLSTDDLEHHLDLVMEALVDRGAEDPTLGGSLASGEIEIAVDVDARNPTQALKRAFEVMLDAIESAGGNVVDSLGEPVQSSNGKAPVSWNRHGVGIAA